MVVLNMDWRIVSILLLIFTEKGVNSAEFGLVSKRSSRTYLTLNFDLKS